MSTEPLQQAIATTRAVLAEVGPDQLHGPTPCASWDVAALVNHIVGGQYFFAAALKGEMPEGEPPDFSAGDFVAAFDDRAPQRVDAAEGDRVLIAYRGLRRGGEPVVELDVVFVHGAPSRSVQYPIAKPGRELRRAVAAAAVGHDHLVAARPQRRERLERGADAARLVQRGDDDRESLSDQS